MGVEFNVNQAFDQAKDSSKKNRIKPSFCEMFKTYFDTNIRPDM